METDCFQFVMAGLDPAIGRDGRFGARRAASRRPRVIAGSSPAMTGWGCGLLTIRAGAFGD
jgi:hypothetical protein